MLEARIRAIVSANGKLAVPIDSLSAADNLYDAGLSSHNSVALMIALEDAFDVEFPDELLERSTFASIAAMIEAVASLGVAD